ncbi:MAG: antibiotic biosynthesis monooxygenase [Desulfobacterales bacterium]|nr:antibiotic biosynthesis monooxygenase [Desulfobacterales bacterium]
MIIIMITMNTQLGKWKEVMQTLLSISESTVKEKGCISCQAYHGIDDNNIFSMIEEWETRKDLDRYMNSNRFKVLLGLKSLLSEPQEVRIYTVTHYEGMEAVNAARII